MAVSTYAAQATTRYARTVDKGRPVSVRFLLALGERLRCAAIEFSCAGWVGKAEFCYARAVDCEQRAERRAA